MAETNWGAVRREKQALLLSRASFNRDWEHGNFLLTSKLGIKEALIEICTQAEMIVPIELHRKIRYAIGLHGVYERLSWFWRLVVICRSWRKFRRVPKWSVTWHYIGEST